MTYALYNTLYSNAIGYLSYQYQLNLEGNVYMKYLDIFLKVFNLLYLSAFLFWYCYVKPKRQNIRYTVWDYLSPKRPLPDDRKLLPVVMSRLLICIMPFLTFYILLLGLFMFV